MALSAVTSLLSSSAMDEIKLLEGIGKELNELKDELEFMRSVLQEAEARGETDEWVKTWVRQLRDVALDAEDILDEYILRLGQPCNQGIFSSFLNCLCLDYFQQLRTRHSLAIAIQQIKTRLRVISKRMVQYDSNVIAAESIRVNTDPRIESLYIDEDEVEVVGIEVPKNILIEWLTKGTLKLTTLSVVGMGGLGKTTLVKKVYDNQMVNKHFACHVWITVTMSPVIGELLRTTIKGVLKATKEQTPEGMDAMDNNELIDMLKNQLQKKRYVIIFDDIWDINVWEAMKFAFPNCDCGSRIIFTTRIGKFAERSNYIYELKPLEEQEAWRLFCMKAFGSNHLKSCCPKELENLSREILKKCRGLPLAIVLIGGLLGRKDKTVWAWKNIHDHVYEEMRFDYDLESLRKILLLSYTNLPYHLKPCYLYLSMFPEDYIIKRMMLIRLWIAEGFVEEKQGVTMEVVAGDYFNEFISRSMLQIAELNHCDEVKSCRIHDLMRETILLKSKEECFSTTIITSSNEGMGVGVHEKARRISIYHNNNNTGDNNYISYPFGSKCSHIRSLMVFQLDESPRLFPEKFFRVFRLLRVLDLEGADLVEFPPELVELIHLRYLSLKSTKITVVPKSVGKLKNLETLDLKHTGVSELPVEILKLQRLRHLLVYRSFPIDLNTFSTNRRGVTVPTGRIGNLTCLQKLSYLDIQHRDGGVVFKELGMLTQLRRLGITNLRSKDGRDLCVALEKMKHLDSLDIEITTTTTTDVNKEEEEFVELESLVSPPQFLRHLYLKGRLRRLPVWIANSLMNLTALELKNCGLSCEEDDPLKAFQHMPNLMYLSLLKAYDGEELCCSEVGGYKNLKKLYLRKMEGLKTVRFSQGSMPMLRELTIALCPALEMVPHGIEHISSLQELSLFELHPVLVERIRKRPISQEAQGEGDGEDCWRVQHIPNYYHSFHNTEGTLVDDKLQ